jgi:hypothetical protein
MGQNQVIVGSGQPELLLEPGNLFGKAIRFAGQPAVRLALGQVISLDKTDLNRFAHRGSSQLRSDLLRFSEDNPGFDLDQPSIFAYFHHMGIQ